MMAKQDQAPPVMGANVQEDGVRFTVWAPKASRVETVIENGRLAGSYPLHRDDDGTYSGFVHGLNAGATYRYR